MNNRNLLALATLLLAPAGAFADGTIDISTLTGTGSGWSAASNVLAIEQNGVYTLTGTTTENRVIVAKDVIATITLRNVSITSDIASPFALDSGGCEVTLCLEGENALVCNLTADVNGPLYAGLQVEGAAVLILEGPGLLTAMGGRSGAGIGSGMTRNSNSSAADLIPARTGTIIIRSGVIVAIGGRLNWGIPGGAGIGGGEFAPAGNITISGGNVFAHSQPIAGYGISASIGAGEGNNLTNVGNGTGNITISGGNVFANRIGIAEYSINTPISISGDSAVILVGNIGADDFGTAKVQTGVSLSQAMLQALAANAFASATADTTIIWHEKHDTLNLPDTLIHDTVFNTDSLHDTLYVGTDSVHDTVHFDTDSVHDTLHVDVETIDTLTDTILIYDTVYVADTVWSEAEVFDTTLIPVDVYDTIYVPIEIIDTTFAPDTIILRDTVVIWNDIPVPLYIVVDPVLGTQTVVTDDAPIIDAANGLLLTALTVNAPFAVYTVDGFLILRATTTVNGTYRFASLSSGTYLLWHEGKWEKFVHK